MGVVKEAVEFYCSKDGFLICCGTGAYLGAVCGVGAGVNHHKPKKYLGKAENTAYMVCSMVWGGIIGSLTGALAIATLPLTLPAGVIVFTRNMTRKMF